MRVYLTSSQIPEMAPLTPNQRRFVYRQCIHQLLIRIPIRLAKTIVLLPIMVASATLGGLDTITRAVVVCLTFLLIDYVFDLLMVIRFRQQVRRFIEEHAAEIQSAA